VELLFVFGRLISSSSANVFQKQLANHGLHSFFIVMVSYLVLSIICIPLLWVLNPFTLSQTFWINIFFAALLDMAGTLFLVMSLSKMDLSVFGPLNAYKVVISMILAMLFLGEIPTSQGFVGISIILIGSFLLFPPSKDAGISGLFSLLLDRGVQYRFLSILLFSVGTLPLKNAVMAGDAISTTVFWCLLGFPMAIMAHTVFIKGSLQSHVQQSKSHVYRFLYLGISMFLMQYMTMIVLSHFYIAYSLALFQLGMVLHVFLGWHIFNEQHILRRLTASGIMIIGSLIVLQA
jgi:uncharacterized membrane protein